MIALKNIHPLSDFLRNAKSHLARLQKTGEPAILTVNGEAQAVVLSAQAYQELIDELEMQTSLNSIHQGILEEFRAGHISAEALRKELKPRPHAASVPAEQFFSEFEAKMRRRKRKAS